MLKDALEFLAGQAEKASIPYIAKADAEPSHIYFVDGVRTVAEPHPRQHTALDLSAVIDFAKLNPDAVVWYSAKAVVCVIDDKTRRDVVRLSLDLSPQLKRIMSWGDKSPPMKQRELILMLRTMFKRSLVHAPDLIANLRIVKFSTGTVTNANIGPSKASIGKAIESEVSNAAGIPEEFFFNVPVFTAPLDAVEALVDVAVETDAANESFTLHPTPGVISRQIALAEESIGKTLRAEVGESRVFYGSPTAHGGA